jgi:hypothetical protein
MLDRTNTSAPALRPTLPASDDKVLTALKGAADRTGTDFGYLLNTAIRESSLNPVAKAATSSATGLFQFIEQTWLGTMQRHGAEHGLAGYADQIRMGKDGRFTVADRSTRQEILALRNDPSVAALMAGELTNDMRGQMEAALGRGVSAGELYVAHFLGPQAAVKMVKAADETPSVTAASLFPEAASANRSIFYGKTGEPRAVSTVLANLKARHEGPAARLRLDTLPETPVAPPPAPPPVVPGSANPASMQFAGLETAMWSGQSDTDTLIMTPLLAQILSSVDPMAGLAKAFGPDKDPDLLA